MFHAISQILQSPMVDEPRTQLVLVVGAGSEPPPPQAVSQTDKMVRKKTFLTIHGNRTLVLPLLWKRSPTRPQQHYWLVHKTLSHWFSCFLDVAQFFRIKGDVFIILKRLVESLSWVDICRLPKIHERPLCAVRCLPPLIPRRPLSRSLQLTGALRSPSRFDAATE